MEVFTRAPAVAASSGPLEAVAKTVQSHLDEVETRIAQQTGAFDPAIEGYVAYAIGGRGKCGCVAVLVSSTERSD